ncbi:hypothetical protein ACIBH1_09800 [Nonomuraea sp. NPDC050663]|uniref:hypothetical protein n=1 Tax=Nonomuraea sp. NPDC050663 TaxID=3364370 RepID=UPI0037A780C5
MLDRRCDALADALAAQDPGAVLAAIQSLFEAAQGGDADETTGALRRVSSFVARPDVPLGLRAELALLCGALVEKGADPRPLVEPVAEGLAETLEKAAGFAEAWRVVSGKELPDPPQDDRRTAALIRTLSGGLLRRPKQRISRDEAQELVVAWSVAERWSMPAATLLQQSPELRADLAGRPRLAAAVAAIAEDRPDLWCLTGLMAVLDGERLVVLERASGRAFDVVIGGIGHNYQLHTLLMHTLVGPGLLDGAPPAPVWVSAATDGPMEPVSAIQGRFNLVGADGRWIWNEGVPADIPVLDGRRVVVLDASPYLRTWNLGRAYPMMRPAITLERELPGDEAARWLGLVKPATRHGG